LKIHRVAQNTLADRLFENLIEIIPWLTFRGQARNLFLSSIKTIVFEMWIAVSFLPVVSVLFLIAFE